MAAATSSEKSIAQAPVILARLFYTHGEFLELLLLAAVPRLELFNQGGFGGSGHQGPRNFRCPCRRILDRLAESPG